MLENGGTKNDYYFKTAKNQKFRFLCMKIEVLKMIIPFKLLKMRKMSLANTSLALEWFCENKYLLFKWKV